MQGEIFFELLMNSDWVHRQVDAISVEEGGGARRKVSFDLTVPEQLPVWPFDKLRTDDAELPKRQLALPLGFLEKKVTRGLDATLDGRSLPVLTATQNGQISIAILNHIASMVEHVTDADRSKIQRLISMATSYDGQDRADVDPSEKIGTVLNEISSRYSDLDDKSAAALLALMSYLKTFTSNYLLVVLVPSETKGQRIVVKYSRDQEDVSYRTPWLKKLDFSYDVPMTWRSASHHFELILPNSLEITGLTLDARIPGSKNPTVEVLGYPVGKRASRAHIVLPKNNDLEIVRNQQLRVYAVPTVQGIRSFTMLAMLVAALLLAFTFLERRVDWVIDPKFSIPSTAVSLLLVAPALLISWIARRREHPIVAVVLKPLRLILFFLALITGVLAGLAAVPVSNEFWTIAWWVVYGLATLAGIYTLSLLWAYNTDVVVDREAYTRANESLGGS